MTNMKTQQKPITKALIRKFPPLARWCLILAYGAFGAALAQARLGETLTDCKSRYGEPLKQDEKTQVVMFRKSGVYITCAFFEGKCDKIWYQREDGEQFSDVEFEALRESNKAGSEWMEPARKMIGGDMWHTTDASRIAVRLISPRMIQIATKEQIEREAEATARKEKERLNGF